MLDNCRGLVGAAFAHSPQDAAAATRGRWLASSSVSSGSVLETTPGTANFSAKHGKVTRIGMPFMGLGYAVA